MSDGKEAADAITALQAEAARLRDAAVSLADEADRIGVALSSKGIGATALGMKSRAVRRAALTAPTHPTPDAQADKG